MTVLLLSSCCPWARAPGQGLIDCNIPVGHLRASPSGHQSQATRRCLMSSSFCDCCARPSVQAVLGDAGRLGQGGVSVCASSPGRSWQTGARRSECASNPGRSWQSGARRSECAGVRFMVRLCLSLSSQLHCRFFLICLMHRSYLARCLFFFFSFSSPIEESFPFWAVDLVSIREDKFKILLCRHFEPDSWFFFFFCW